MKKFVLAALAILGVALGAASLSAPANATEAQQSPPSYGFGWG
jgi:hypothetical protein